MLYIRKFKKYYRRLQLFVFTYIVPKDSSAYLLYKRIRKAIFGSLIFKPSRKSIVTLKKYDGRYERLVLKKVSKPAVSIIIPVHNKFPYTYGCVKSIVDNTPDIDYEIIIADDVSDDETSGIEKYFTNVRVSRNTENLGFVLNCNKAAKMAKGRYILFLNNDTQVQKNWLSSLVRLMETRKDAGMTGSKLVYPDGKLQEAGGIIWKDASASNYGSRDYPEMPEYNYVKEVDYISGAAIMIRRRLWDDVGGFDERYRPAYCEDSDLAFKVRKAGFKVLYQPKSVVVHFEGISHGTDTSSGVKRYQNENREKFRKKWKSVLAGKHCERGEDTFHARDRSAGRKTILVIDKQIPTYDRDAGSRTVFQYLSLFVDLGYNVKFIGDDYVPIEPYTSVLEEMGVEVLCGRYMKKNWKEWIRENSDYIDYVLLNRPPVAEKYIDYIRKNCMAEILYYGHDLHFLRELRRSEVERDLSWKKSSDSWKKREYAIIGKSDMVLYPSNAEIDILKKDFPDKSLNVLTPYFFSGPAKAVYEPSRRKGIMFVGGFNHAPNVDAVVWFFTEVKPRLDEYGYKDPVYIVGSNPTSEVRQYESSQVKVTGFVSDDELDELYGKVRLVFVPLRYGAGIKGKVVESMVKKVPMVMTTIAAEGLAGAGKFADIADDPELMASAIAETYSDFLKMKRMSVRSAEYISANYSTDSVKKMIKRWFK